MRKIPIEEHARWRSIGQKMKSERGARMITLRDFKEAVARYGFSSTESRISAYENSGVAIPTELFIILVGLGWNVTSYFDGNNYPPIDYFLLGQAVKRHDMKHGIAARFTTPDFLSPFSAGYSSI